MESIIDLYETNEQKETAYNYISDIDILLNS